MVIVVSIVSPEFRGLVNIFNIFEQNAIIGILACGMAFMLIVGGFDLSVGSVAALSGVVTGLILRSYPNALALAVVASLAVGVVTGLCNGVLISKVGINPFVTTLGTMVIARGVVFIVTEGKPIYGFPMSYNVLGMGRIGPVPILLVIWGVVVLLTHVILKYTRFGQYVYAVGGNETAARLSGVNVDRVKILTPILMSVLASLAGILLTFRVMSALAQAATGYELIAIAAAVVGGCVLGGGKGTILGTIVGTLMLGVIINALHMLGVSTYWEQAVTGFVILAAVGIDALSKRVRT
jgi:ribose/xylose/arabinose/galactoside ABC-type transport system permease subunit